MCVADRMEISGLLSDTTYNILLSVSNARGYGPATKVQVRTPPMVVPKPSADDVTDVQHQSPTNSDEDSALSTSAPVSPMKSGSGEESMVSDRGTGDSQQDTDSESSDGGEGGAFGASVSDAGTAEGDTRVALVLPVLPSLVVLIGVVLIAASLVICIIGLVLWVRHKPSQPSPRHYHENDSEDISKYTGAGKTGSIKNRYGDRGGDGSIPMTPLLAATASSEQSPAHPLALRPRLQEGNVNDANSMHTSPQIHHNGGGGGGRNRVNGPHTSQYGANTSLPVMAATNGARSTSAQKQAWDSMLQRPVSTTTEPPFPQHHSRNDRVQRSMSDLPLPPHFLLVPGNDSHEAHSKTLSSSVSNYSGPGSVPASASYTGDRSRYTTTNV